MSVNQKGGVWHASNRVEDQLGGAVDDVLGANRGKRIVAAALHGDRVAHGRGAIPQSSSQLG
jgi:hypothetical protein